jgi:putative ABC transport system substrate-binding protein
MAADLVREQVRVIISPGSTPAALAAQAATKTIPIVFEIASDPVELGLVSGLNKPGANVTGVTTLNLEIGPKRLELPAQCHPERERYWFANQPHQSTARGTKHQKHTVRWTNLRSRNACTTG